MYERVWWYFRYRVGLWWMIIVQCKIINEIDIFQYVCTYVHLHVWKCAHNDNKSGSLFVCWNQKQGADFNMLTVSALIPFIFWSDDYSAGTLSLIAKMMKVNTKRAIYHCNICLHIQWPIYNVPVHVCSCIYTIMECVNALIKII